MNRNQFQCHVLSISLHMITVSFSIKVRFWKGCMFTLKDSSLPLQQQYSNNITLIKRIIKSYRLCNQVLDVLRSSGRHCFF